MSMHLPIMDDVHNQESPLASNLPLCQCIFLLWMMYTNKLEISNVDIANVSMHLPIMDDVHTNKGIASVYNSYGGVNASSYYG